MSSRLSPHFSLAEMLESDTARRNPALWREQCAPSVEVVENLRTLAQSTLQPLRDLMDWPILVNSGYRCAELNRLVGGSERSYHCGGLAADIRPAPGWEPDPEKHLLLIEGARKALGDRELTPTGWLFAAAALEIEALGVDQLIHEYGDGPGAPAWVHISRSRRPRHQVLAIGEWTDGRYASYASLAEMGRRITS